MSSDAFGGHNLAFVEDLYYQFLADPDSVDPEWRAVFEPLREERPVTPRFEGPAPRSIFNPRAGNGAGGNGAVGMVTEAAALEDLALQDKIDRLANRFRGRGHLAAALDPLGRPRPPAPDLEPAYHGLSEADLERPCYSPRVGTGSSVGQVIRRLRNTYCRYIGVEYLHVDDVRVRDWLQERMESTENRRQLTRHERMRILTKLIEAETFEQFIRKKYLGAKSFSLEGGESLIPLLDLAIEQAADQGIREVVIGMAHRGRLSVLANILHKPPSEIFREFDDKHADRLWGRGDVKYHMGYRSKHVTSTGKVVDLRLAFNPSHLEFVSPVVLGRVRARQDRGKDRDREHVMPIVLHGDAAFAGQGVSQETLNMGDLPGYWTGGAVHVIVNNQIGFTTPPESSRCSQYATDVAHLLKVPIFHVNGEHPESVAQVVHLAMDFRARFRRDVFIDMYCYRRHGHNEGDEPAFTQPKMYEAIRARPTVVESYIGNLAAPEIGVTRAEVDRITEDRNQFLEEELARARESAELAAPEPVAWPWDKYRGGRDGDCPRPETGVPKERLAALLERTTEVPHGFKVLSKLERILEQRRQMASGERPLDWAAGELLAYATLLADGHPVRISGQDCGRGTFSHRHAVFHDTETEASYSSLRELGEAQGTFEVYDSPLTEQAVLGFEYGYSLDRPDALVVWEAQFGDFCNGAQVIIDQFITSAEDKWDLLSGLVLLLPHGFEGQGPEHSSARLERFLQLCAEDNVQVVNVTTPAQIFHALRRQVVRPWRKPLIVMSPKSLLRLPQAVSSLDDLVSGTFQRVIPDQLTERKQKVKRVLCCSGRVYYDLLAYREEHDHDDVAIVRVEQLYPFPHAELRAAVEPFIPGWGDHPGEGVQVVWTQEEPVNMGAWTYLRAIFGETFWGKAPFGHVARDASASPATGSPTSHKREQAYLVQRAFGDA
ncbi:MAG: 2-oxoglutarate dehydrogenase E1 component [Planctomycetota bacterium]